MEDSRSRTGSMLGDYRLQTLIGESPLTLTWLAEQASIRRPVVLFELKSSAFSRREDFLGDIRVKAAVDHPLVGSVYEAVSTPEHCYATLERLPGSSLMERSQAREGLKPVQLANILRRVADASLVMEAGEIATSSMGLDDIFLDSHGVVRVANLARAGARSPARSAEDILALGKELPRLLADGLPGSSRVATLLAWMRGEGLDRTLTWEEVRAYAEQIEQQLTETPLVAAPKTARAIPGKSPLPLVLAAAAVLCIAGIGLLALRGKGGSGEAAVPLPPAVAIPAGEHPLPDGGKGELAAFSLSGHEVTIREYSEFLDELARLSPERKGIYDHRDQPAGKSGHEPGDWAAMRTAAKTGGQWDGRPIGEDYPVVNVDWWDAAAYCAWKGCRLPSQEEWFAALRKDLPDPAVLRAAGWGSARESSPGDRTPAGLCGMAGSVSEWTSSFAANPANPLGEEGWVICGASFLEQGGGALARRWVADRGLRSADLGFRVVER